MNALARLRPPQPVDLGIPGPSTLDMARAFRSVRADPLAFLTAVADRYGDLVAFPVPGSPALLVNDPAAVRHVLQTAARRWGKQTVQYTALARVTGPGLLASGEPSWIEHRRQAAPAFHHERLLAISDQVRAAADEALGSLPRTGRTPAGGAPVDVAPLLHRLALDAVGRALFSADLSGQAHRLLAATSHAATLVVRVGRSVVPTPEWAPTPVNLRLRATRRRLDDISSRLVAQRRAGLASPSGPSGSHGDDLLGLLLDSGMADQQVRHEVITMIIAGHETVATALTWTLMLLAENPAVQDRVRAELAEHPGPVPLVGHQARLPWTRAVVDEALRLFPPAWALSRRANVADVVGDHVVPAGTTVIVSPWLLHRRPESWADAHAFRPERFLNGEVERSTYLPFGQGPRLCIGREFALGEMVVVLDALLRTHRLALPEGWARPQPDAQVAVHPRGGMRLVVEPVAGRTT